MKEETVLLDIRLNPTAVKLTVPHGDGGAAGVTHFVGGDTWTVRLSASMAQTWIDTLFDISAQRNAAKQNAAQVARPRRAIDLGGGDD